LVTFTTSLLPLKASKARENQKKRALVES